MCNTSIPSKPFEFESSLSELFLYAYVFQLSGKKTTQTRAVGLFCGKEKCSNFNGGKSKHQTYLDVCLFLLIKQKWARSGVFWMMASVLLEVFFCTKLYGRLLPFALLLIRQHLSCVHRSFVLLLTVKKKKNKK